MTSASVSLYRAFNVETWVHSQTYTCLTADGSRKMLVGLEIFGFASDSQQVSRRAIGALWIYAGEPDAQCSVDDDP